MMQSDAAVRRLLFSLISLQTLELNNALPACTGTLEPIDAYNAVIIGAPRMKSPPRKMGFNRSVALEGFFPEVSADMFECAGSANEFKAKAKASNVTFSFDDLRCPLSSISVYKSEVANSADPEVGFRLDFEGCSSALLVGVKKNPTPVSHMVPWMRHICHRQATTTSGEETRLQVEKQIVMAPVGAGKCAGTVAVAYPIQNVSTAAACKTECQLNILELSLPKPEAICKGYAFNPSGGAEACILYNVSAVSSVAPATGYNCWNMTQEFVDVDTSTEAPLTAEEIAEMNKAPTMKVAWGADTALLEVVGPADASQTCVQPFNYFTLQDEKGKKAMIPVDDDQWQEMIGYLSTQKAPTCECKGEITADRVAFVATAPGETTAMMAGAWKRSCPASVAAAVAVESAKPSPEQGGEKEEEAVSKECVTVNTMVSVFLGLTLPAIIWFIIAVVYFFLGAGPPPSSASTSTAFSAQTEADFKTGYSEKSTLLSGPGGQQSSIVPNPCTGTLFLICAAIAVIGSLVLAWFGVEFLSLMLSSMGCAPSFFDMMLIKLAGALATMVAVILGLRQIKDEKYEKPKDDKLVLGRLDEVTEKGEILDDKYYYHGLVTRIEGGADGRYRIS